MAEIGTNIATNCGNRLVDTIIKEVPYLCCYKSYVEDFENKKGELLAAVESVGIEIEEARKRNQTRTDPIVQQWLRNANNLIQHDTKPKKWFGCFSQYVLAKELERTTQEIPMIMDKVKNFPQVARAAEPPGMEFYLQEEFMHFESRKSKFEQLLKELKDDNKYRIALQAMGGSGKTTMAKAVGKEVEKSKLFDKVIFIVVSKPADEKKIRDAIARQLELELEEEKKLTHAQQKWIRIADVGKVLIILDDVWEELNLQNVGIQLGIHSKGRCYVLLTTRDREVCTRMGCQETIRLEELTDEDALNLFLSHANANDCSNDSREVALDIVKECGRLVVSILVIAKTLRNWNPRDWQEMLMAL